MGCYAVTTLVFSLGLPGPWGHRFFTSGMIYFVCGTLTYKLYENYLHRFYSRALAMTMLCICIAMTLFNTLFLSGLGHWFYFGVCFISIPFVFDLTKNIKWDRFIGEFSYPAYLSHYLFLAFGSLAVARMGLSQSWWSEIALVGTILGSYVLLRFVSIPIDRIREERVVKIRNKSAVEETKELNAELAQTGELKGVVNADKQV